MSSRSNLADRSGMIVSAMIGSTIFLTAPLGLFVMGHHPVNKRDMRLHLVLLILDCLAVLGCVTAPIVSMRDKSVATGTEH